MLWLYVRHRHRHLHDHGVVQTRLLAPVNYGIQIGITNCIWDADDTMIMMRVLAGWLDQIRFWFDFDYGWHIHRCLDGCFAGGIRFDSVWSWWCGLMVDASLLQFVSTLHVVVTMLSVWHRRTECDINSFFNICSCSVEWMWTRAVLFIYLFTAIYLFCISFNLKESFVLFDTNKTTV